MTVAKNVAFGLEIRKRPKDEVRRRVAELLDLVQLDGFGDRYPSQLSGGQRQRMALARALAVEPEVLLLDEPFGALDARVRSELRAWLRRLHDEMHVTTVFVTHDQDEAMEVSDTIVLMDHGAIVQEGHPQDLYDHPGERVRHAVHGPGEPDRRRLRAPARRRDPPGAERDDRARGGRADPAHGASHPRRAAASTAASRCRRSSRATRPTASGSSRAAPSSCGRAAPRRSPRARTASPPWGLSPADGDSPRLLIPPQPRRIVAPRSVSRLEEARMRAETDNPGGGCRGAGRARDRAGHGLGEHELVRVGVASRQGGPRGRARGHRHRADVPPAGQQRG